MKKKKTCSLARHLQNKYINTNSEVISHFLLKIFSSYYIICKGKPIFKITDYQEIHTWDEIF